MVLHICEKCHKEFKKKSAYMVHTKNVNCLKKINNGLKCEWCNLFFMKKSYFPIHVAKCKEKYNINNNIEYNNIKDTTINNNIFNNNADIITNNNIVNNTNITIQFKICNFGEEKFILIDKRKLFDDKNYIILNLIKDVYTNELKPENHNVLLTDKNRKNIKIIDDGEVISKDTDVIVDKMIDKSHTYLRKIRETRDDKHKDKIDKEITDFIINPKVLPMESKRGNLNAEVKQLLYDKKEMIKNSQTNHKNSKQLRQIIKDTDIIGKKIESETDED